jgi:hypothetical protein
MLQRYDLFRDDRTNCLSIKEFAILEKKSSKMQEYTPDRKDYALIHEVSYDCDTIRSVIREGQKSLIAELRTGDFFPVHTCAEIIAKSVTALFKGNAESHREVFFDDRDLLSTAVEK